MKRSDFIIGIDPDCDLSGVAILDVTDRTIWAETLPFPLLIKFIKDRIATAKEQGKTTLVVIEQSWNTSHNWHLSPHDTKFTAARKGYDEGRNHEVGKKIVEMLNHLNIETKEQIPLKKTWKTKDGKISHDILMEMLADSGISTSLKRTNQEKRDAVLLAINESGIPMRLNRKH